MIYVHKKVRKIKLDEKSWKDTLVGYVSKGYKVWGIEMEKFITVRDVIVEEINYLELRPLLRFERVGYKPSIKKNCKSDNVKSDGIINKKSASVK